MPPAQYNAKQYELALIKIYTAYKKKKGEILNVSSSESWLINTTIFSTFIMKV